MYKIRKFAALIVVLIFTTFFSTSYAQSSYYIEEQRVFYGGLIIGSNFTQVDGDNFAGYHKMGLNVGGIVYATFSEHVAASLEILYSQKGSRSSVPTLSNSQAYAINKYGIDLNYAEVPVQINYFDKRKSHFGAGFSYSQLASSNEYVQTSPTYPVTGNLAEKYQFKKYDLNFIIGGNLHLVKGLFMNIRFQYSLLPVRKDNPPEIGRAEQYNNMWTVRLMYLFM
ncbi:MAG: outer membrane beta-barrel protein [Bacteroidota bacterium]